MAENDEIEKVLGRAGAGVSVILGRAVVIATVKTLSSGALGSFEVNMATVETDGHALEAVGELLLRAAMEETQAKDCDCDTCAKMIVRLQAALDVLRQERPDRESMN